MRKLLVLAILIGLAASASAMTISPKVSYVGWLGIGAEFAPLYKITDDVHVMAEANYDFWAWSGSTGYIYGEVNAVYNAQKFNMGQGKDSYPLWPYAGGGLVLGFPMGTPNAVGAGNFSGGIGFAVFGGVTGKLDPYTWFAQLKFGSAPITYNWDLGFGVTGSASSNALGAGMEFGIRLPL